MSVSIIGLGMTVADLTARHLALIKQAEVLVGGRRHLAGLPEFAGTTIPITADLAELTSRLKSLMDQGRSIVVLASGDPLFYGIGDYLARELGPENVTIYPNINSISAAFSRLKLSHQEAAVISLHGRPLTSEHIRLLKTADKIAILTDHNHTPKNISKVLTDNRISNFRICVLEHLGMETESLHWYDPGEAIQTEHAAPNLMVLLREAPKRKSDAHCIHTGMPDEAFQHEKGLITKPEVRAVTLAKLSLYPGSILWDLGAGSGSVSIEASQFIPLGRVYAVEQKESRIQDIQANQQRFQTTNLTVIHGRLPAVMDRLPDPDRIFIGGGGRDLVAIVQRSLARLLPGGILVINTVLLQNMARSLDLLEQEGLSPEIVQLQVSFGHAMPWNRMLKSGNPVWIIQARKKDGPDAKGKS